jgi:class 3 adenylate cyclase
MAYDPPRLDRSLVDLTGFTEQLIEAFARQNHDVWARQKLDTGHVLGDAIDPDKKTHNCLVDYSELSEEQKEFDRLMAIETWKQLVIHGFQVVPPRDGWRARDDAADVRAAELKHTLETGGVITHARLLKEWKDQEADPRLWARYPVLYSLMAQRLLNVGEADNCYDVARAGLRILPGNPALTRWQAMALVELSATRKALELMSDLRRRHDEPETRGFLAYAALRHADELLYRRTAHGDDPTSPAPEEQRLLKLALEEYRGAQSDRPLFRAMFSVGAAIVASRLGHPDTQISISAAHATLARAEREPETTLDVFWRHTFAGELALLESRVDDAIASFRESGQYAERRFGLINSSYRMARTLSVGFGDDVRHEIEGCFKLPTVVVFAGHMFDQPGQTPARFPAAMAAAVKSRILNQLRDLGDVIGYASAASGSDILFHEAVREIDGDSYAVLPYHRERFFEDSVALPGLDSGSIRSQFQSVLDGAVEVVELCPQQLVPGSASHDYCNRVLLGMARLHADRLSARLQPMCVWDGRPGNGPGGTASAERMWKECGHDTIIINPADVNHRGAVGRAVAAPASGAGLSSVVLRASETTNHAILFADVRGFSKLSEEQLSEFIEHYLGRVGVMLKKPYAPIQSHTSGDGLYMVFKSCRDAGLFGLELSEMRAKHCEEWTAIGLPPDLDIRVALHFGPVLYRMDPITRKPSYFGQHVSRAARLEPVTDLNSVFVTFEFAAWASTENITEFTCDYLGKPEFAKGYGNSSVYALRRLD